MITWVRKLPHRVARAVADAPLRVQLVGAVLVLVLAALTASGIAGTRLLRNYLVGRTDSQLTALAGQVQHQDGLGGLIYGNELSADVRHQCVLRPGDRNPRNPLQLEYLNRPSPRPR